MKTKHLRTSTAALAVLAFAAIGCETDADTTVEDPALDDTTVEEPVEDLGEETEEGAEELEEETEEGVEELEEETDENMDEAETEDPA